MERSSEEGAAADEEDGDQVARWIMTSGRSEDEVTPVCNPPESKCGRPDLSVDTLFPVNQDQTGAHAPRSVMSECEEGEQEDPDPDPERDAASVSPSSLMDTCAPSISSLFSSSSSSLCLTPPLPPSVEISALLTDTRLNLDVYQGGAAALPLLCGSIPGQLKGLQYLRLGSEDKPGLDAALDVLPHLTELRSLAIRGHCFYDSHGDPLPGLLTTLPSSVCSLSLLVHLDLSFNQLSSLPPCLLSMPLLSSLLLCHNHLSALPPDIGRLHALTYLSLLGNQLVSLPPSLGQLKALQTLDVSYNCLQHLPDEIGYLGVLVKLELSHNKLKQLPETMGSLLSLRELFIYSNELRLIPDCVNKLPLVKIDARNNPLG